MVWQVFYSYAQEDAGLHAKFGAYLKPLVLSRTIVDGGRRSLR